MPLYQYTAKDQTGQNRTGQVEAADTKEATNLMRDQGLWVMSLKPIAQRSQTARTAEGVTPMAPGAAPPTLVQRMARPLVSKVSVAHLYIYFNQFATLLRSGIPVGQATDTLSRQTRSSLLAKESRAISAEVLAGRSLTESMAVRPHIFRPLILNLVAAGETGGLLDRSMQLIATYLERELALRRLLSRVTFYPKVTLFFAIAMPFAVYSITSSLGRPTNLGGFLSDPVVLRNLLIIIVIPIILLKVGAQFYRFRYIVDTLKLYTPVIGGVLRQIALARFARSLGALYSGGVALPQAVEASAMACGNEKLAHDIYHSSQQLREGGSLTQTLRQTGSFSPVVLDLIATGEQSGNLDEMTASAADFFEAEAESKSHAIGILFGVLTLLIVAVYVLVMVAGAYTSYFSGLMNAAEQNQ